MIAESVQSEFRRKVSDKIRVVPEGLDRFLVCTPFLFEDGDHLSIVLKKEGPTWILTDEGLTYMHLTYEMDEKELHRGTRQKIITNALSAFRVDDREGELIVKVSDNEYGDALYSFVQALLKITDVSFLSRERVRSTFMEDFRAFFEKLVPEPRRQFVWHDPINDSAAKYPVDCKINQMARPLFVYALPNDDKVRDATICLLQFERWKTPFRAVGIFEDQEEINRKVLARFSDVCEKQFSSLTVQDRISKYFTDMLQ